MQTAVLEREPTYNLDFEKFGVDIKPELERRNALVLEFGQLGADIDDFEHQRSKTAYRREFLDDVPYSTSQIYYQDLYTLPYKHPLFRMSIDPQERGGLTELGFEELRARIRETRQDLQTNGKENEVVIWYSSPGPAGEGRFRGTNYDTGRLYPVIVQPNDFDIAFDIKIDEEIFPLGVFLDVDLLHPKRTHKTFAEFSEEAKRKWGNKKIYDRQRFTNPKPYTLGEILTGIEEELTSQEFEDQMIKLLEFRDKFVNFSYQKYTGPDPDSLTRRNTYLDEIREALREARSRNQKFVVLYGCSAVGIRTADDLHNLEFNFKSIFETAFRTQGLSKEEAQNDPNLCHCGNPSAAHFHCPGKNESCKHPIIVGEGTTQCPSCGMEAIC